MRETRFVRSDKSRAVGSGLLAAMVVAGVFWAPTAKASAGDRAISSAVDRLVSNPSLGARVGVHVRDVGSGFDVADVSSGTGFIPASTMKLITAYTALRRLGPDHRFTTSVYRAEDGRLVLHGGGDPVLTSTDLRLLATRTARALRRIELKSSVVVGFDDDYFPRTGNAPGWEAGDMPAYVSAVQGLGVLGSYSTNTSLSATRVFVSHLKTRGVTATVGGRADVKPTYQRLARLRSNDVAEAVATMMPPSENNIAEVLFRHVAVSMGKPANWIGSRRSARIVLRRDGFDIRGSSFVDGSGLSYRNRLTPQLLTHVLKQMDSEPWFASARRSLPIAGVNGTMIRRFAAPPASCARGAIAAKTGSLPMTVTTLAGLTKAADGTTKAFAIMVNDRPSQVPWAATSAAIDTIAAAVHGCVR